MPIREWHESFRISIECSDQELPRVLSALQGQQLLPPLYTTNNITNTTQTFLLPSPERRGNSDQENMFRDLQRSLNNG